VLVHVSPFWTPKRGCSEREYEDAYWVGPEGDGTGQLEVCQLRVTVADGASESLLAGLWARRLVNVFGTAREATQSEDGFIATYQQAAQGWGEMVARYRTQREERNSPIQWYEEPGLIRGAYATILAFEIYSGRHEQPSWTASGLGDSCLFQVRDEQLLASFPISDGGEFSYQPPLLPSKGVDSEALRNNISLHEGEWERGDSFYLATDALAAWFLETVEARGRPWEPLRDLDTQDAELDFSEWVDERRDRGEMHDDDTTLVRIDTF
jgi:hypothetical protein